MDVDITTLPDLTVAYIRHIGPYQEIGNAFCKLSSWAEKQDFYQNHQRPLEIGLYWDNPKTTPPDQCKSDACIVVNDYTKPDKDSGIDVQVIKGGKTATWLTNLYDNDFPKKWNEFNQWLSNSKYKYRQGPSFEIYYCHIKGTPLNKWVIDFCMPIE